jgi:hypothetical protein
MIWRPGDRRTRLLGFALAAIFGVYSGLYAAVALQWQGIDRFGDYFAFWADGRLLAGHPARDVYDPLVLASWQQSLGMQPPANTPFAYPPSFIPVVQVCGLLPLAPGFVLFMTVSLALYLLAIVLPRPGLPLLLVAVVMPTTIVAMVSGQTGLLTAALLLGGLRLAPARPLLGGALLALLTVKPQFGIMVPLALAAAGLWRCTAAVAVIGMLLVAATTVAYGWQIWANWLAFLPGYSTRFARESGDILYLIPTLTGMLRTLGWAASSARLPQLALAAASAIWVFRTCRQGLGPRAVLVVATATLLATPYAFVYDLPVLSGAVLLFAERRLRDGVGLATVEIVALALTLVFPAVLLRAGAALPIGPACLLLLAGVLLADPAREPAAA